MTTRLYVTSTHRYSGKSAVCVALLRHFQAAGYKVGYQKPVSTTARQEDANFIKNTFGLEDPLEALAPVILTEQKVRKVLRGEVGRFQARLVETCDQVSRGKDVVILEGGSSLRSGYMLELSPLQTVELLDARVVVVVGYKDDVQLVDDLLISKVRLADRLAGTIINQVPPHHLEYVEQEVRPFVEARQVPVLATLPQDRLLQSITIGELADCLEGEFIGQEEWRQSLVENLAVGAMDVEHALSHFRRSLNKAVIVGGDRADIQIAALETSTKVLILTGNLRPASLIQARAEERGVAIIVSPHATLQTVEVVEQFFGKSRFHQTEKVKRFEEMFNQRMDFAALHRALGLAK